MSKNQWSEVDEIIEELDRMEGLHSQHPSVLITPLIRTAKLHAKLTKINEESARTIVRLTWALVVLTVALLFFTIVLYKDTHQLIQREKTTQDRGTQKP